MFCLFGLLVLCFLCFSCLRLLRFGWDWFICLFAVLRGCWFGWVGDRLAPPPAYLPPIVVWRDSNLLHSFCLPTPTYHLPTPNFPLPPPLCLSLSHLPSTVLSSCLASAVLLCLLLLLSSLPLHVPCVFIAVPLFSSQGFLYFFTPTYACARRELPTPISGHGIGRAWLVNGRRLRGDRRGGLVGSSFMAVPTLAWRENLPYLSSRGCVLCHIIYFAVPLLLCFAGGSRHWRGVLKQQINGRVGVVAAATFCFLHTLVGGGRRDFGWKKGLLLPSPLPSPPTSYLPLPLLPSLPTTTYLPSTGLRDGGQCLALGHSSFVGWRRTRDDIARAAWRRAMAWRGGATLLDVNRRQTDACYPRIRHLLLLSPFALSAQRHLRYFL